MKTKVILLSLLLCIGILGCEDKEDKKIIYPDIKIEKELPVIEIKDSICKEGEIVVINSQKELDSLFKDNKLPQYLTAVDFEKNTVILSSLGALGRWLTTKKIQHTFTTEQNGKYTYAATVQFTYDVNAESNTIISLFGIIIEKIPLNSKVALAIIEIAPEKINKHLAELKCPPVTALRGKADKIIGKWKLTRFFLNRENQNEDISCKNIFFEFKKDSTLTISEDWRILKKGTYKYEYINMGGACPGEYNLIINNFKLSSLPKQYSTSIVGSIEKNIVMDNLIRIK